MYYYFLLFAAIILEIIATTCLKLTQGFSAIFPTIAVLMLYAISLYLMGKVVKAIPIGVAYAIWSGLGIVGTSIASYILYNQILSFGAILGIAFVLIGTVIIQLANPASHV